MTPSCTCKTFRYVQGATCVLPSEWKISDGHIMALIPACPACSQYDQWVAFGLASAQAVSLLRTAMRSEAILTKLTPEDRGSLMQFRAQNGRTWRAALREEWIQGQDCGWVRRVRNTLGPSGIYGIK